MRVLKSLVHQQVQLVNHNDAQIVLRQDGMEADTKVELTVIQSKHREVIRNAT